VLDKVLVSERANLLLIPAWREDRSDQVLSVLVKGLLGIDCTRDVRPQIQPIQDAVWQYYRRAYECRMLPSLSEPADPTSATTPRVFLSPVDDLDAEAPARQVTFISAVDA